MLILFLILIIMLVSLIVVLWGGAVFIQGYVYTEPSPGVPWRAPVLAAVLTFGYAVWCLSIALSSGASPSNIPINTIFRFTDEENTLPRPASKLWAIKQDKKKVEEKPIEYVSVRMPPRYNVEQFQYFHDPHGSDKHPWFGTDVVAIEIQMNPNDANRTRFNEAPPSQGLFGGKFDLVDLKRSRYREFRSDDGWVITEYEQGPTGLPVKKSWGRFLLNLFFNAAHFAAWFAGLWFILRFQWLHSLGLAVVMWLVITLLILPMMLGYAGQVSEARRSATASSRSHAPRGNARLRDAPASRTSHTIDAPSCA